MPFKSESQRRYLWAKHPDIARRWAHEYPNQKKLPKHVGEKKPETAKSAAEWIQHLCPNTLTHDKIESIWTQDVTPAKVANSKQEYVALPQTHGPSYAGQEKELTDEAALKNGGPSREQGQLDDFTAKSLFRKLAVVLAPKLLQEVEDENARIQGRLSSRVPQNVNVKRLPAASPSILPPMGMAPPAPHAPAPQPAQPAQTATAPRPVGAGSSPQANPIQSFGGLSSTGDLNGNASFGTRNAPGALKAAGLFNFLSPAKPAPSVWAPPTTPVWNKDDDYDKFDAAQNKFEKNLRAYLKTQGFSKIRPHHYEPGGTPWSMLGQNGKYHEIWMPEDGEPVNAPVALEDLYEAGEPDQVYRKGSGLVHIKHAIKMAANGATVLAGGALGALGGGVLGGLYGAANPGHVATTAKHKKQRSRLIAALNNAARGAGIGGVTAATVSALSPTTQPPPDMSKWFPRSKVAAEDPVRLVGTGLASLIGGLGVGSYPGWKLQTMSEQAGNHPFVNFVAGKAPIAVSSALSAGLFNYLYDLKSKPKKEDKQQPEYVAPESLSYLKYLVH